MSSSRTLWNASAFHLTDTGQQSRRSGKSESAFVLDGHRHLMDHSVDVSRVAARVLDWALGWTLVFLRSQRKDQGHFAGALVLLEAEAGQSNLDLAA
jgi:hypothetical protein